MSAMACSTTASFKSLTQARSGRAAARPSRTPVVCMSASPRVKAVLTAAPIAIASTALTAGPALAEGADLATTAGKWAVILLVADVVTGIVLGKSALNMFKKSQDDNEGGQKDWKERMVDDIMEKQKAKAAAASAAVVEKEKVEL